MARLCAEDAFVVVGKIVERHLHGDRFLVNLAADVIVQDFALEEPDPDDRASDEDLQYQDCGDEGARFQQRGRRS